MIGMELHVRQGRDTLDRLYRHGYICCPFQNNLHTSRPRPATSNWTAHELLAYLRQQVKRPSQSPLYALLRAEPAPLSTLLPRLPCGRTRTSMCDA